jgi:hypothetical protein
MIGNFYRDGKLYTKEVVTTLDHDWKSLAQGVVIPYGLYDLKLGYGFVTLGTSSDTSEFACDSLLLWWHNKGKQDYPQATSILLLCDGGGSNRSNTYLFKVELERFSQASGLEVRVAHYPPYTSKYNPIEHRLFPHLTRACQGVVFTSIELVKELMSKATTKTGLKVYVNILDKVYETGRRVANDVKERIRVVFDEELPQWNYRILPNEIAVGNVI